LCSNKFCYSLDRLCRKYTFVNIEMKTSSYFHYLITPLCLHIISICIFNPTPASVPIEMKCSTAQQPPNENCNNLNSNSTISSGIVDGSNIMAQINPTPILQTNHVANMNVSSPSESHHKSSPSMISTGTGNTASSSSTSAAVCGTCLQPICDRYIMKVADSAYHEKCLQCNSCYCSLTNTCFQRDNQLFCRKDYER
jgi:hypothetical protein